jgi:transcriptional regulator with XRE-family HTH domain
MGRAIGQAITDDGMTQSEFARRVGCSEKHLSRVITGLDTASGAMLDYWAFALGRRWTVKLEEADTR